MSSTNGGVPSSSTTNTTSLRSRFSPGEHHDANNGHARLSDASDSESLHHDIALGDSEHDVLLSGRRRSASNHGEEEALLGRREPEDRYNLVYFVFYLLGMGTLLPWNFFISVNSFWDYKFRDVNATDASVVNSNNTLSGQLPSPTQGPEQQTELQKEFTSYLAIASNVPNAICVILHALFGQRCPLKYRLFISLAIVIVLFFFVLAFSKTDSDDWQREFLELILIMVVFINICTAFFQGSVFGVCGRFPPKYMSAVMAGQAMGGIFPSVVDIVVLALQVKDKDVGFVCFLIATVFLILSFFAFAWVRNVNFFKHYSKRQPPPSPDQPSSPLGGPSRLQEEPQRSSIVSVVTHAWQHCASVYIVFGTTLVAFPAVTVLVESQYKSDSSPNPWPDKYFTPVTCFLLFNCGDYLGRILGSYFMRPKGLSNGRNPILLVLALLRIGFIPLFMYCNAAPTQRTLPVYFDNDWLYILFMVLFSVSNGYLGNLGMIQGPKIFSSSQDQELCAMVLVACLVLGTGSGSFLSYPVVSAI